jgi:hypothetical protein
MVTKRLAANRRGGHTKHEHDADALEPPEISILILCGVEGTIGQFEGYFTLLSLAEEPDL